MDERIVQIGLIQTTCVDDVNKNVVKAQDYIMDAAKQGANIICLQELFTTTYFCNQINDRFFEWSESIPGLISQKFQEIALKYGVVLILPYFERATAGIYYNSAVVIDADGSYLGKYRKSHIPDDPGFYEKYYFTSGDTGYKVFDTKYGKVGVLICWDQWFPEAARLTALKGADIIFYPTAIGTLPDEEKNEKKQFKDAWEIIQRSHAIANGCFVASVNRVGKEGDVSFWGHSFVSGPFGEIMVEAGENEGIFYADCDFNKIEKQRQTWPFLRDRRIDTYDKLSKRYLDSE